MSSLPNIAGILENAKKLEQLRKEQEEVLVEIDKMHKKLQSSPEVVERPGDTSLSKLKSLYIQAKELSESEVTVSNILLTQLDYMFPSEPIEQEHRKLVAEGNDQKRERTKVESDVTRVPPSIRNQIEAYASLRGEQVAAKVTAYDGDNDERFVALADLLDSLRDQLTLHK